MKKKNVGLVFLGVFLLSSAAVATPGVKCSGINGNNPVAGVNGQLKVLGSADGKAGLVCPIDYDMSIDNISIFIKNVNAVDTDVSCRVRVSNAETGENIVAAKTQNQTISAGSVDEVSMIVPSSALGNQAVIHCKVSGGSEIISYGNYSLIP